ncbi:MAG: ATP-binding cassette domain-containing protein [Granulosicoccus sp.]|nr:ATP-binding cassette domain-containing protein [Granulosicoccus sp.]
MDAATAVSVKHVDVLFGPARRRAEALQMLDRGCDREAILDSTGVVLGVADASLAVPAGSIAVLMGLSGSGKSSLLRCINGLNEVTRGVLEVTTREGVVNVASCKGDELRNLRRHSLAMVFQQFALLPWASVRENIGFGLSVRGEPESVVRQCVDKQLELVGLEAWADKPIHTLSGGMQQRVGLARAFATDADILLMDEPFSALDPLIREHLQDELLELQSRLQKTIVFVSHDLDEALKLGNQISIMDGGRIVQTGSADDIVFRPANDYVRRFIANINPLSVLTAAAVMQPISLSGDRFEDTTSQLVIRVLGDGEISASVRGRDHAVQALADTTVVNEGDDSNPVFCVRPDSPISALLNMATLSHCPILVLNDDGIPCGLIRDRDLLLALQRQ